MKRAVLALAALLLAVVAVAGDSGTYSLDVDVSPTIQPDSYVCRAMVTDLATGSVIFAPSIQLKVGSSAERAGKTVSSFLSSRSWSIQSHPALLPKFE